MPSPLLLRLALVLSQVPARCEAADGSGQQQQQQPTLVQGTVDVTKFGAVPDGETNNVAAIDRASAKCVELGGCTLLFPPRSAAVGTTTVYPLRTMIVHSQPISPCQNWDNL